MLHTTQELQHFYNQLPQLLSASNNIDKGHFKVDKKLAYKYQWVAHRQDYLYSNIIVDFDQSKANECWYDRMIDTHLQPNLVVKNPTNNNAHLIFRLKNPISNYENSRTAPFDFYNIVRKAVTREFGGDQNFVNFIAKNPVFKGKYYDKDSKTKTNKRVEVVSFNNDAWELSDFTEYVDLYTKEERKTQLPTTPTTEKVDCEYRNKKTFEAIRLKAYAIAHLYKKNGNRTGLYNQILHLIGNYQSRFNHAMSISEQISTANSITNYCMNNAIYVPKRTSNQRTVNFGRDTLKTAHLSDLKDKQIVSAVETNKSRKTATERKIRGAVYDLKTQKKKITIKAISEITQLHRNTISQHKELIKSLK